MKRNEVPEPKTPTWESLQAMNRGHAYICRPSRNVWFRSKLGKGGHDADFVGRGSRDVDVVVI